MSRKAKKGHSIPNPVAFTVVIDTDDDFTIDGETQINRTVTVTGNGSVADNLSQYLLNMHYESSARNAFKVSDFKKMIGSLDFVSAVRYLTLPEDHFDYSSRVTAGGNHSIVVTLNK